MSGVQVAENFRMKCRNFHGFTLVELMIVVVIIGILAAIAYPSYQKYMTQTRRSDAKIALTQAAARQEKYFADCSPPTYAGSLDGTNPDCAGGKLGLGAANPDSPKGYYRLAVAAGNIPAGCAALTCGFTITATPKAGGLQDGDGAFRIDALGTKQWDANNNSSFEASENTWGK